MSSKQERDIARQLAEREGLDPPAGLLERIKSEIPATIQLGDAAPQDETRGRRRDGDSRQRWLLAASLVAMVGAGLFALLVRETAPPLAPVAASRPAARSGPARPSEAPGAASPAAGGELEARREIPAAAPRVPPPPVPAPREVPRPVEGGVSGGVVGGVPSQAPPAAPAAKATTQPVQAAPQVEDQITVTAESPLRDERRPAPKPEGRPEYYDFDNFVERSDAKPAAPAVPDVRVVVPEPKQLTDRINVGGNESGQQSSYVGPGSRGGPAEGAAAGKAKDRPYPSLAAAAPPPPVAPFRDAAAGRRVAYGDGVDSGSFERARREVAAGRLPDPKALRVGDFLGGGLEAVASERGRLEKRALAAAPARAQLLEAQGAPDPFGTARSRLLLFRLRGGAPLPAGARMEVELNPEVVARYREIGAGPGPSALYEVELKAEAASGRIATLHLRGVPGAEPEERTLELPGLAASWEGASPGFRLAVLAAELAESLKGHPWAPADLGALARQIRAAAREVPGNPRAAGLADLAEAAARLRGNGGP